MERHERPGETAIDRLIRRRMPADPSWEAVLMACQEILCALWQQLEQLVGQRGTGAIFGRAVQVAAQRHALVGQVQVGETGLDFSAWCVEPPPAAREALDTAVSTLGQTVVEVVEGLIGSGLVQLLLADVEMAIERQPMRSSTQPGPGGCKPGEEPRKEGGARNHGR